MTRPVFWSRDALDELRRIGRCIAKDNPQAARNVAAAIRAAGDRLGERATGRKGRVSGTYEKTLAPLPYVIAYALHPLREGGEGLTILRVIHTARDWPRHCEPEAKQSTQPRHHRTAAILVV